MKLTENSIGQACKPTLYLVSNYLGRYFLRMKMRDSTKSLVKLTFRMPFIVAVGYLTYSSLGFMISGISKEFNIIVPEELPSFLAGLMLGYALGGCTELIIGFFLLLVNSYQNFGMALTTLLRLGLEYTRLPRFEGRIGFSQYGLIVAGAIFSKILAF